MKKTKEDRRSKFKGGFYRAEEFFQVLRAIRICFLKGTYGSGKTLLSCALAVEWWRRRWAEHIQTNLILEGDFYEPIPDEILDTFVIYDEAWQTLDSRTFSAKASQQWLAYLRKRNVTLVLPSVLAVDVRFRVMMCQRALAIGDLFWTYRWIVEDGLEKYGGYFFLIRPLEYRFMYNHKEEPDFDRSLWLGETLGRGAPQAGKRQRELLIDPDASIGGFDVQEKKVFSKK